MQNETQLTISNSPLPTDGELTQTLHVGLNARTTPQRGRMHNHLPELTCQIKNILDCPWCHLKMDSLNC